jgi:hypothetical protein
MAVNPRDLEELRRMESASRNSDSGLEALTTIPAVYGYLITCARNDGDDEADVVELLARHSGATASEVRGIAATLRRLGYRSAADRLTEIAGRRRFGLRPLA